MTNRYRWVEMMLVLLVLILWEFPRCASTPTDPTLGQDTMVDLPGGVTMEMAWIEPGTFTMGSSQEEIDQLVSRDRSTSWYSNEGPQHKVTITKGFWLGKYEITQEQWDSVMGNRPWSGQSDEWSSVQESADNPAVSISWNDVQAFIEVLNAYEGGEVYRLPTESEWEYACRAGTTTRWSSGDDEHQLEDYAWYDANASNVGEKYGHKVGTKLPNPWGLYDMHGNVWELCQDWYGPYSSTSQIDPTGPSTGSWRAIRGGVFFEGPPGVRSAHRYAVSPDFANPDIGVRLVRQEH